VTVKAVDVLRFREISRVAHLGGPRNQRLFGRGGALVHPRGDRSLADDATANGVWLTARRRGGHRPLGPLLAPPEGAAALLRAVRLAGGVAAVRDGIGAPADVRTSITMASTPAVYASSKI